MYSSSDIGRRIQHARAALGWTQTQLAKVCEIAPTQFSRYESGRATPRPETLSKIAAALNVTIEWLATGEGPVQGDNQLPPMPEGFESVSLTLPADLVARMEDSARQNGLTLEMELLRRLDEKNAAAASLDSLVEQVLLKLVERAEAAEREPPEQQSGRDNSFQLVQTTRDALLKPLQTVAHIAAEGRLRSRTPQIPGVNAPKEGLGGAPKAKKPEKATPAITKKKVAQKIAAQTRPEASKDQEN